MPIRRRYPHLPKGVEYAHIGWDLLILTAVAVNLGLLLFDSLFLIEPLNQAFAAMAPSAHAAYDTTIHSRFTTIDLMFVGLFVADVLLSWTVAIAERRYHRWFFYPFVHWYDVLGCIPVGGFRLLRILRVVSLLHRLHRLGLITVTQWPLYRFFAKYYDILLEELSDRIALRLLGNVQQQITSSGSLSERVIERVIMPRKRQLIHEITQRLEATAGQAYQQNRSAIQTAISELVSRTLRESPEIRRLQRLPMGHAASSALEASLSGVAQRLVDEIAQQLHSPAFRQLLEQTADSGFDSWLQVDQSSQQVTEQVLLDILEMLKEQVARQRWKDRYE
ncbi:ion transporter [Halomonas sp. KM007]